MGYFAFGHASQNSQVIRIDHLIKELWLRETQHPAGPFDLTSDTPTGIPGRLPSQSSQPEHLLGQSSLTGHLPSQLSLPGHLPSHSSLSGHLLSQSSLPEHLPSQSSFIDSLPSQSSLPGHPPSQSSPTERLPKTTTNSGSPFPTTESLSAALVALERGLVPQHLKSFLLSRIFELPAAAAGSPDNLIDAEILENHFPWLQQAGTPLILHHGTYTRCKHADME